jgi:GTP-binding protein Era
MFDYENLSPDYKCGYVALIGKPNVGKSTLMNAMLGQKLSIVTPKAQTTRHRVLGIYSDEGAQIVFLDTPGIIKPRYRLHELMMHAVEGAVADADLVVFMVDAKEEGVASHALSHLHDKPSLLVLNKMDLVTQTQAIPLVESYTQSHSFESVIPMSALNGQNLDILKHEIISRLPTCPPFYPPDQVSEHPERFFVAEIVREKIFELFDKEVPYSSQVNIVAYEEREGRADYIDAEIVVERNSQKGIIIGKQGAALKQIGMKARTDIEALIGKKVFLQLHVKVRDDWRNKEGFLNSFGYKL